MYENDKKFEMFKEEEKDLILDIALGDFKLKLKKNDIRNEVKTEIWKAALREYQARFRCITMEWKKLLMYFKFGSSPKRKSTIIYYN
jgi:hypothetical protein